MKTIKRISATLLALMLTLSVMSVGAITASADSDLFFKFSKDKEVSQNGLKTITYTDSGMKFVSPADSYEVCYGRLTEEEKSYIEATYDLSGEDTQAALATAQSDKNLYRVTCDIKLNKVEGVTGAGKTYTYKDWNRKRDEDTLEYTDEDTVKDMGFGVEAILIFKGKDAEGKEVSYKTQSTVSPVEFPSKTLSTNLPADFVTIDTVTVRFGQGSDLVVGVRNLDCEIGNLKVTKLSTPAYEMVEPNEDCVVDYSNAYVYQLGSARMAYSGMITANADESCTELYPNSAYTFKGTGYVGPDCFSHGWEDMGVAAVLKDGALSKYDGVQCYFISRETDNWTVAIGTFLIKLMVPNRDAKGNYLDANGKKVSTEAEALKIPVQFEIPEKNRPASHAGTVMKFTFDFNDFEPSFQAFTSYIDASKYSDVIGEYYDEMIEKKTMKLNDYKQYATEFHIAKGLYAYTGKPTVDFSVGDVYGCKYDKYGELSSSMPEPTKYEYEDPNAGNVADDSAIQRFVELYEALPKMDDLSKYYADDGTLKAQLSELMQIWGSLNEKSKKILEVDYGITQNDYAELAQIWDLVFGEFDAPQNDDFSLGADDFGFGFDLGVNPETGVSAPVSIAVTAIAAAAVIVAIKRKRK